MVTKFKLIKFWEGVNHFRKKKKEIDEISQHGEFLDNSTYKYNLTAPFKLHWSSSSKHKRDDVLAGFFTTRRDQQFTLHCNLCLYVAATIKVGFHVRLNLKGCDLEELDFTWDTRLLCIYGCQRRKIRQTHPLKTRTAAEGNPARVCGPLRFHRFPAFRGRLQLAADSK